MISVGEERWSYNDSGGTGYPPERAVGGGWFGVGWGFVGTGEEGTAEGSARECAPLAIRFSVRV